MLGTCSVSRYWPWKLIASRGEETAERQRENRGDEGIINETEFKIEIRRNPKPRPRPKVRAYLARKVNEKFFLFLFFGLGEIQSACEIGIALETETC